MFGDLCFPYCVFLNVSEFCKVRDLRFSSQFPLTLWVFRRGRGAAGALAHAAVDAAAPGGCPPLAWGPSQQRAWPRPGVVRASLIPGGPSTACPQGAGRLPLSRACVSAPGEGILPLRPGGLASWQRSLLGFYTSRPSQVGTQSCGYCGALFLGILPESSGLCGGLGVQHPAVGDLGQRAGRPCLLGLASSLSLVFRLLVLVAGPLSVPPGVFGSVQAAAWVALTAGGRRRGIPCKALVLGRNRSCRLVCRFCPVASQPCFER